MTATDRAVELAVAAAEAASEKLAKEIIALDVSSQLVITDAFVLASADNDRQVRAVVDAVEDRLRELGAKPVRREGLREARWVLLDFNDVVVHVQHAEDREFYALERLWKDCPVIELPAHVHATGADATPAGAAQAGATPVGAAPVGAAPVGATQDRDTPTAGA